MKNGFLYFIGLLSIALVINVLFIATIVTIANSYVAVNAIVETGLTG